MPALADRVKESTATTGQGTVTLAGAAVGFQSFTAAFGNGVSVYYVIAGAAEWEVGIGTTGAGTLTRDTVIASSAGGTTKVTFSAGTKDVFCSVPSSRLVLTDDVASTNTANAVVKRDGSGNFAAGTITATLSGNASTATALQTARTINGVSFNGTADITVTAQAGTLSGTTLASGVTASSLTSVGTLSSLTVSGNLTVDTNTLFVNATNNRVGILNASPSHPFQISTTGLIYDTSGNLGLGVTPSAWSLATALQVGFGAALSGSGAGDTSSDLTHGAYFDGTNWQYLATSVGAARYRMTGANGGSTHAWFVSAGGTGGNTFSFTQIWSMSAAGHFLAGTDNTYDIGASGATRPRSVFVGTSVKIGSAGANAMLEVATGTGEVFRADAAAGAARIIANQTETILGGNIALGVSTSFGGGSRVVAIREAETVPSSNPVGNGLLYVQGGALKYRGTSGTVTTIANA